jgi:hypothetical protein
MSTPPSNGSTDLGETRKIFAGVVTGRRLRDLSNTGEVFLLASEIAEGNSRRASMLSMDETRAIARLATGASIILHHAILLVAASDAPASADEIKARLEELCAATRAITEKETNI